MGVVMCQRCDKYIDLDYNVEDAIVLPDGMNYSCFDCLTEKEREYIEESGETELPTTECDPDRSKEEKEYAAEDE